MVIKVEKRGFASSNVVIEVPSEVNTGTEIRLRPLGTPIPFEAEDGANFTQGDVQVTIPPDSVVDFNGEPVTGTVEATVVLLDPSNARPDTLPGPLEGEPSVGAERVSLESVVMAEVSIWHNGLPANLAPNAQARLEITLPNAVQSAFAAGDTVPAWWLDLDSGVWRQAGAGSIEISSSDVNSLAWVVDVNHFTWWNADKPFTDKHCFTVTVLDFFGAPVPGIEIGAIGTSYSGFSGPNITNGIGQACIDIKIDETADIYVGSSAAPLATVSVTGTGPAADCNGNGAPCVAVTVSLPLGAVSCTPGESLPCSYSGPPGTEGVGICTAGRNQCDAGGTGFSGCIGEIQPTAETCDTEFDDDCNGEANEPGGINCACFIGDTVACYTGAPDTLNVGLCEAGLRTCNFLVGQYGPCTGEVLPVPENCATVGDDDCNGDNQCDASVQWTQTAGGLDIDSAEEVVVDSTNGNVIAAGLFANTVDFGGGPLVSAGGLDVFVVAVDANGNHVWSRRFGGTGSDAGYGIGFDPGAGTVLVTGVFGDVVDFGGGPLTSAGGDDIFLLELDATTGAHVSSRRYGDTGNDIAWDTDVDSLGNVIVTGDFAGTIDFGGGPLTVTGSRDAFLLKLDSARNHVWSARFGDTDQDYGREIDLDNADNVIFTGFFASNIDFGLGPLSSAGGVDVFLAKFAPDGTPLWGQRFGSTAHQYGLSVAVDNVGNIALSGVFENQLNLGGSTFTSNGLRDMYVAKFDPNGAHLWSHAAGSSGHDHAWDLDVDAANNVLQSGDFRGTIDFGNGPLTSAGNADIFVVKYGPMGIPVWSTSIGGPGYDGSWGITANAAGDIYVVGEYSDTVTFGLDTFVSNGSTDAFITKLNP